MRTCLLFSLLSLSASASPVQAQGRFCCGLEEAFNVMEHKIDRISELPEPILEHILSFIPLEKIPQLSILSKRWQNVWALLPILEFNQYIREFNPVKLGSISVNEKEQKIKRMKYDFNYFMEKILRSRYRQRLSINKFKLEMFDIDESDCALLNRCIGYAIESNVKEFNVELEYDQLGEEPEQYYYQLPESVLTTKSITKLSLYKVKLDSFNCDINLPSLKKLYLDGVHVEEQFIQTLIASCRVVEDISFKICYGLKSIHVSGLPKLMVLKLKYNHDLERVEVQESSLQSLRIHNNWIPCQINLAPCENLKELVLHATTKTSKWLHDILLKHPRIEKLDLTCCNMLEWVYISSPHMKTLNLSRCEKLVEVNINTPNLHSLGYCGGVISFALNVTALLEANLDFVGTIPWHVEKIAFLANYLNHPKLLTWRTASIESVIIPKELRESQQPFRPLYNVKKLELKASSPPKKNEISELVDSMLWISPLLEILFIEWKDQNKSVHNIFFKFSYENPVYKGKENPNCCKLLPNLCWRHCLKTVKIEDSRGFADEEDLGKYFHENAKILKSFQGFAN